MCNVCFFAILLFISASLLNGYTPPLLFVSEVEPDTPTSPNWTAGGADGQDRTENSRWRAAARGGTTKGGCSDAEERVLWRASFGSVILQSAVTARWGLKMNSLILLSLFATVFAGKSPRLKFVVHGRQSCIFWLLCGFSPSRLNRCFINQLRV